MFTQILVALRRNDHYEIPAINLFNPYDGNNSLQDKGLSMPFINIELEAVYSLRNAKL
jgi:hypothetical protein